MLAAIFALIITADPPPPVAAEPRHVVFAQPLITLAGLVGMAAPDIGGGLALSGGAQFAVNDDWGLTLDAAGMIASAGRDESIRGVNSAALSIGPTFRIKGSGLSGFFITPKGYVVVAHNWTDFGPSPIFGTSGGERWSSFEAGGGVDFSLQWTKGGFFIGTVLGVGGGIAMGAGSPASSFSSTLYTFGSRGGFVLALNVHLLRIGYAF